MCHESLLRKAEAMCAELAGADPTPAVTMMVDLVVGCWLEMQDAQLTLAEPVGRLPQRKFAVRRAEAAHKKFLASVKMLETTRTLLPVSKGATTKFKVFEPAAKEVARVGGSAATCRRALLNRSNGARPAEPAGRAMKKGKVERNR